MSTRQGDVIILGAGICGLALACLCAKEGMQVVLVDQVIPEKKARENVPPKAKNKAWVSAMGRPAQSLLASIGVWEGLQQSKQASAYTHMNVHGFSYPGLLELDASMVKAQDLGHIVNNGATKALLWQALGQHKNIQIIEAVASSWDADEQILKTTCDKAICASLLVGCDGVKSWARQQTNIIADPGDGDGDIALVGLINHTKSHYQTARQCFMPSGVIALLPLWDSTESAMVYSIKKDQDRGDHSVNFALEGLQKAFPDLGSLDIDGELISHPIVVQHAKQYHSRGVVLVGDAAMSLHPLAGLGLNCGLQGVAVLANELIKAQRNGTSENIKFINQRYQKAIRGYNALTQQIITLCYKTLDGGTTPMRWFGQSALWGANSLTIMKRKMIEHALYGMKQGQ